MENLIDTLFEVMKKEWDAETFAMFLSNVYGLGHLDGEAGKDPEPNQIFLIMSPLMSADVVNDYIMAQVDEYIGVEGLDEFLDEAFSQGWEESEEELYDENC